MTPETTPIPSTAAAEVVDIPGQGKGELVSIEAWPSVPSEMIGVLSLNDDGEIEITRVSVAGYEWQLDGQEGSVDVPFDVVEWSLIAGNRECVRAPWGTISNVNPVCITFRALTPTARLKLVLFWEPLGLADARGAEAVRRSVHEQLIATADDEHDAYFVWPGSRNDLPRRRYGYGRTFSSGGPMIYWNDGTQTLCCHYIHFTPTIFKIPKETN